jgi:hypothetical protein
VKRSILTVAAAIALVWVTAGTARLAAQSGAAKVTPSAESTSAKVPRTADGHPDLSGVWWRGADVGGKTASGGSATAPARGPGGAPAPTFTSLYTPAAAAKAKTLSDKDDPALGCTNTAFGTLNVSLFDVGAVGQIVQTPKFLIMLTETYNSFQIIPIDGRPRRDAIPPSNRGDGVGHWEGDTLVVDKTNFTDTSWIYAEGRVSFHSDAMHVVERYRRVDANTLEIEATIEDPKVLTKPWIVPKQTLVLAPFDQIMELACSNETQALIEAAQSPAKK